MVFNYYEVNAENRRSEKFNSQLESIWMKPETL